MENPTNIDIKLLTGKMLGWDQPTTCHSGGKRPCAARTTAPGRHGWTYVKVMSSLSRADKRRDGWWCPECVDILRELMAKLGFQQTRDEYIPIDDEGHA